MASSQNGDHAEEIASLCLEDSDNDSNDIVCEGDTYFDQIIGHIEDILMDPNFQILQRNFMEKYWKEFDESEENKLIYMDIFKEYTDVVEKYIEDYLLQTLPDFNMNHFTTQLEQRRGDLEGEVFEMLFTFTDFIAFKEMFVDYKAVKEGKIEDLSNNIHVTSV